MFYLMLGSLITETASRAQTEGSEQVQHVISSGSWKHNLEIIDGKTTGRTTPHSQLMRQQITDDFTAQPLRTQYHEIVVVNFFRLYVHHLQQQLPQMITLSQIHSILMATLNRFIWLEVNY